MSPPRAITVYAEVGAGHVEVREIVAEGALGARRRTLTQANVKVW